MSPVIKPDSEAGLPGSIAVIDAPLFCAIRSLSAIRRGTGVVAAPAARALKRADAEVVLIDRRNHHIFQPLLYQAATGVLSPSEIAARSGSSPSSRVT